MILKLSKGSAMSSVCHPAPSMITTACRVASVTSGMLLPSPLVFGRELNFCPRNDHRLSNPYGWADSTK
ncbi:hypothetical protein ACPV3U_22180 [Vibrio rotiferianus]